MGFSEDYRLSTKIVDAKVIVTCPGRNFVTLKITTADGMYGIGDATLNGRELAVVAYLQEHMLPCLIGRNAARIEDTWQYLYRGAYTFADGMMQPGDVPGHGVDIDETLAAKFPYKRAYLPVCRLADGTLHSW